MGGSGSKSIFEYSYQKERSELRKALILSFIDNPENKDILSKITAVRSLVTQHPEICITAARELEHKFDYSPTSLDAAYNELERLFTIYETSTIMKSVQCRIGQVACPLGHYCPYFDNLMPQVVEKGKKNVNLCGICDKAVKNGHQCSYCCYTLCVPCSTMYCCHGHALKLWTHPESQHSCIVCKEQPITSGYRCTICEDYDICDYCTYKPGRKAVQEEILHWMKDDLKYLEDHVTESETAMKTMQKHHRKMSTNYATTLQLYEFYKSLDDIKIIAVAEVRQTRITREVQRLRALLSVGKEHSATAMRESKKDGNFTVEEIDRLTILYEASEREKSPAIRNMNIIACPLGHACLYYQDQPLQYLKLNALIAATPESLATTKKKKTKNSTAVCKICDRVAAPGYHCDFCEYDLCTTCAVIFCSKGHPMKMWTQPESILSCSRCFKNPICGGYHCNTCNEEMCDECTAKEGRGLVRNTWEAEVKELLYFMKVNKRLSDIAEYYHWRSNNYIVSTGLLVEYVNELRTAKVNAEKQIAQKAIIDKIKGLRAEVIEDAQVCATAAREAAKSPDYIFPSKKRAVAEVARLQALLDMVAHLRTPQQRTKASIACPLGHAAPPIDPATLVHPHNLLTDGSFSALPPNLPDEGLSTSLLLTNEEKVPETSNELVVLDSPMKSPSKLTVAVPNTVTVQELRNSEIDITLHSFVDNFEQEEYKEEAPRRECRICGSHTLLGGHSCTYCEYDLCPDCSVVYCRESHPLIIWTLPDAFNITCSMCKKYGITSGYRCVPCGIDMCDMCTSKDSRNAFMFWPRREIKKIMIEFETLRDESDVIHEFLLQEEATVKRSANFDSMGKLCKQLRDLQVIKQAAIDAMLERKKIAQAKKYGIIAGIHVGADL